MRVILGIEHTGPQELTNPYEKLPTINNEITYGTESDEMDLLWHDQRTIAASASEDLDLADGTLIDAFGVASAFVEVRMICIVASADNTNDVVIGGSATSEWLGWLTATGDKVTIPAGAISYNYTPNDGTWAVTSGSSDTLKIANSGGTTSVTYDIYIGGTSA